ncbi:unnamed protein product [Schistosoma haematobium]|nr:unnamed protein product [Schistosoma haematobium]
MFDKHAKSDEQLLLYVSQFLSPINVSEQAKFISYRRAANSSKTMMVSSDSCRKSVPLSDYVSSVETKTPCFLPTIVEHPSTLSGGNVTKTHQSLCEVNNSSHKFRTPKSIFGQEMERAGFTRSTFNQSHSSAPEQSSSHLECLNYLRETGPQIITGAGLGTRANEVERIHQENLERLSQLTEKEILEEREKILSLADPNVLSFLIRKGRNLRNADTVKTRYEMQGLSTKPTDSDISSLSLNPDPKILHMDVLEVDKLEWTRDLPPVAKKAPSVELYKTNSMEASANEASSDHLETNDHKIGKYECGRNTHQARFDLSGLVVPPEADVDTYLGLHHHGEEPERAGYTIAEMFHLCRSSVPAQRRLALSMLGSSLVQTRLGRHIRYLAPANSPSLITCLLSSKNVSSEIPNENQNGGCGGILFLLRWCLDEAVSTLTSTNSVGGNKDIGGASLALVTECIRCLANLICDTQSELFLNYAYEWPIEVIYKSCLFIAPPIKPINTSVTSQQSTGEEHDDSELAANDPVEFLFIRSKLARRIAWLLAPGKGRASVCLTADAAGLWLPSIIIRGLRHSSSTAYEIFRTPELVSALLMHYLPVNEYRLYNKRSSNTERPNHLSSVNNIPLPSIMRLCRIWIQVSDSILLAFVNDHHLIERCLSYLCYKDSIGNESNLTTSNLVGFLHNELPICLAIQLQIESIRCLNSCFVNRTPPYRAVCLLQNNLSDIFHSAQNCWILYHSKFIIERQTALIEEDYFLTSLLTSWIHFLINLSFCLMENENNNSTNIHQTIQMIIENVLNWCCELENHISKQLQSNLITPAWESFEKDLTEAGLNTSLMAVVITSSLKSIQLLSRINLQLNKSFHEQSINHWNNSLTPIFKLPFWNQMLYRFIQNESILTGSPVQVRDVSPCLLPESSINVHTNEEVKLDWTSVDQNTLLDDGVLQLVSLSPSCLPNYGTVLYFCYDPHYSQLSGLTWPKVNSQSINSTTQEIKNTNSQNQCDQVSFNPKQMNTRYLPLMSAMINILESIIIHFKLHMITFQQLSPISDLLLPLVDWIKRVYQKSFFLKWKSLSMFQQKFSTITSTDEVDNDKPHLLISIESELITRILLLFSQILELNESNLSVYLKSSLCCNSTLGEYVNSGNIIHLAALRILPYLRKGQEELRTRLILEVIFNNRQIELNSFNNTLNIEYVLRRLHEIRELYYHELVLGTKSTSSARNDNEDSRLSLSPILEDMSEVNPGHSLKYQSIFQLNPVVSKPRSVCDRLISKEWVYLPFIHAYLLSKSKKINEEDETYRKLILDRSLNCLTWINYLQKIANLCDSTDSYNFGFMDPVESIVRLTLGSISYPGAGGLGFEPTGQLLAEILYSIGPIRPSLTFRNDQETNNSLEVVKLPVNFPSYYDLYIDLVNHYNALSYNSPVFANLVLWPCQQLCHVKYRRALWGEHQQVLNSLRIVLNQLVIPLSSFLEPVESNSSMIRVYAAAILSGTVQITRQPLLFLIAVHHLNRYLYNKDNWNSEFTQQFVRLCKLLPQVTNIKPTSSSPSSSSMQTIGNKTDILNLLRFYKQPNKQWLQQTKSIKLNTNLHVGIHDSLVHLINNNNTDDYTNITNATTFNEAILKASIECYNTDTLPKHRQLYWIELFKREKGRNENQFITRNKV